MHDFTPMILTVPMWGSEVANSKTEIHLTNKYSIIWHCHPDEQLCRLRATTAVALQQVLAWSCTTASGRI